MYNLFWEVFKRTGNIEAYLYLYDYKSICQSKEEEKREIGNCNDNFKYPGNST